MEPLTPILIIALAALVFFVVYYIINIMKTTEKFSTAKIVYVYSNSCGFCRTFTPTVDMFTEHARKSHPNIEVSKMEASAIAANAELSAKYTVDAYPTILMFDESGKKVKQIVGKRDLDTLINELLP